MLATLDTWVTLTKAVLVDIMLLLDEEVGTGHGVGEFMFSASVLMTLWVLLTKAGVTVLLINTGVVSDETGVAEVLDCIGSVRGAFDGARVLVADVLDAIGSIDGVSGIAT